MSKTTQNIKVFKMKFIFKRCKECAACKRAKVTRQHHHHRGEDGHTHLLTMNDRSTRWPEAVLLRETTTEARSERLRGHMGAPLWRAVRHHNGQRGAVHLSHVGWLVRGLRRAAHHHHGLPPSGQWDSGEASPPDEGRSTCQGRRHRLGGSSALGHARFATGGI